MYNLYYFLITNTDWEAAAIPVLTELMNCHIYNTINKPIKAAPMSGQLCGLVAHHLIATFQADYIVAWLHQTSSSVCLLIALFDFHFPGKLGIAEYRRFDMIGLFSPLLLHWPILRDLIAPLIQ